MHGARFSRLDEPFDEFDHLVCATDGSTGLIAKPPLMEALEDKVPGLGASPIPRAVREGVLLLRQVDSATWELAVTRPSEGKVRALVPTRLLDAFLRLVNGPERHPRESRFDGWREVDAFDVTALAEPRESAVPELASVRCLERIEIGPQLHLVGGIRVDGGYLGLSGLLPEVHCAEAEHAALFSLSKESGSCADPRRDTGTRGRASRSLRWSPGHGDLEGAYVFAGSRNGRVVAPREILFHSRALSHDYECPTDPSRWCRGLHFRRRACWSGGGHLSRARNRPSYWPGAVIDALAAEGIDVLTGRSVDDDSEHDRLVEALAAISVARKGIGEAELIEILGKIVRHATGFAIWGIIRGWVEAGSSTASPSRQWRGRVLTSRAARGSF